MVTAASRTQEERRAETRGKLLDATVRSLSEVGFAATTSRRVSEMAGVSLGAQTHHFPHRLDLMGAAVEWAAQRRVDELREIAADLPELWVAAADDPELHAHLVPVESRLTEEIASLSGEVVPEGIEPGRQWSRRLSIAFSTIRGLALTEHFEPRGHPHRDPWPETRLTLLELLAPGLEPSHRKET